MNVFRFTQSLSTQYWHRTHKMWTFFDSLNPYLHNTDIEHTKYTHKTLLTLPQRIKLIAHSKHRFERGYSIYTNLFNIQCWRLCHFADHVTVAKCQHDRIPGIVNGKRVLRKDNNNLFNQTNNTIWGRKLCLLHLEWVDFNVTKCVTICESV